MTTSAPPPTKPPAEEPAKPAEQKFDAFHPKMPQIPGVKQASPGPNAAEPQGLVRQPGLTIPPRLQLIGGIAAATLVIGVAILWWVKSIPRKPVEASDSESPVISSSVPDAPPTGSVAPAEEGPGVVATVEELAKPWAAKKFIFENTNPLTRESVKAMVIRLPGGALWAFSLQVPYSHCELELVTDVGLLATQYGYRASHPMVVNPCDSTIYDPLKVGPLGGNVWVRGEIAQGGDLRPPISIDVQVKGHSIIADRIE